MTYILDTNILIRAKNDMPFDLWPTFWHKFRQMVNAGDVYSIEKVRDEINRGNDDLTDWVRNNAPKSFFIPVDGSVVEQLANTQTWASQNPVFKQSARNVYAEAADAFLVATAKAKGMTLVTYETSDPNCKTRVKIPDACDALGVRYCDFNTVLRELKITI